MGRRWAAADLKRNGCTSQPQLAVSKKAVTTTFYRWPSPWQTRRRQFKGVRSGIYSGTVYETARERKQQSWKAVVLTEEAKGLCGNFQTPREPERQRKPLLEVTVCVRKVLVAAV